MTITPSDKIPSDALEQTNSTPDHSNPVLVLEDVHKSFGQHDAVAGLSLQLERGKTLALLGPNGAGKTTTISMCEGFLQPTSGSISVLGLDPYTQGDQVRSRVGIMLQGGGAYSGIRTEEILRLTASYSANPIDPQWLIELLGLENVRRTTYRRLSGGQQQRLSLAIALVRRPELVFLDEPTAGMDAQSRKLVWRLLEQLRQDGVSTVLTTHLMDEAENLADEVIIIDQGKRVASGTPQELQNHLGQKMVFHTNREIELPNAPSNLQITHKSGLEYEMLGQVTPQKLADLSSFAASQDIMITRWNTHAGSLEDVFLEITDHSRRNNQ